MERSKILFGWIDVVVYLLMRAKMKMSFTLMAFFSLGKRKRNLGKFFIAGLGWPGQKNTLSMSPRIKLS